MISSIKIVIELFAYLYCLAGLFGKKFKISVHAMILLVLDLFVLTGINEYGFPEYLRSLTYIGMFVYGLLYYMESFKVTLVNSSLAAVIIIALQLIFCFPLYYVIILGFEHSEIFELFINGFVAFTVIAFNNKVSINKLSLFFVKRNKLIVIIAVLAFIGVGVNLYTVKKKGIFFGEEYVQLIYFLVLFGFTLNEWQKSRMEAEKRKTQLEMNKIYYEAYDQLIMLIRERQHDMKNHINAILSMIHTTDNYEDLVTKQREYCNYVLNQNEKTKLLLSSKNPLITGFLYSKIREAEEKGISVDYYLSIRKTIEFPEYELIEMLGILLDNAIEALEKAEIEKKKIYVSITENETEIDCVIGNVKTGTEDRVDKFFERGYSTKGENRGIGLAKLKNMVYARKGDVIVSEELYKERKFLFFELRLPNEH